MKTWTKVVIGAGALAAVAGGVAYAQGGMGRHGMGPGMMGPMGMMDDMGGGEFRGRMLDRVFGRLDADKDGTVTVEEALKMPDSRFADVDTNKDGFVDKAEVDAMIAKVRQARIDAMVKRFDVDGDGKISKEEAEKPFRKRFALFDRNDDGKVTREEAEMSMPMRGRGGDWGGHHGRGGHHGWDGPWGPDRL